MAMEALEIADPMTNTGEIALEENRPLLADEGIQRGLLKCELDKVLLMEEISWRQKSRELWLKAGDKNTAFFHRAASANRRRNKLEQIKVQGRIVTEKDELADAFVHHFEGLFCENDGNRPFPAGFKEGMITVEDNFELSKPFTEAEIWSAIRDYDGDKTPGPDGFTLAFFKKCWNVIKKDVLHAFDDFYFTGNFPDCVAHSFICLIPKKDAVEEIKDFRPISLLGSPNKLIAKVLMQRLRSVSGKVISKMQFSGAKGKQIHEAALIANELVDSRRKSGKPGLVFKLDIEKAFNSVSWDCLFKIVASMGFSPRIQRWIRGCVSSPKLSVLVNGEATGFFQMHRGLRQGDPLSPFLFNLVMDILSFMLEQVAVENFIFGFRMDEDGNQGEVTHLLYADDTVIFCDATVQQVQSILAVLVCFQSVTGLKINLEKSKMFPIGDVEDPDHLENIFGCDWEFLPAVYLGLPLGAGPKSTTVWNPVITRLQKRLERWKGKFLSLGGRIILNNSCLAAQPLYFCSLLEMPKSVLSRIEGIQRRFIWTGSQEKQKMHLIKWEQCKTPRKLGGLGILDIEALNEALLCKWLWRFGTEDQAWWKELISTKFPNNLSNWRLGKACGAVGCSLWSQIMKKSDTFWKFAHVEPGSGAWVSFWHDCWIPGLTLADAFPRVAAAASSPEGPSCLLWLPAPEVGFTTHSLYKRLMEDKFPGCSDFPHQVIWRSEVPLKVAAFAWLVLHKKILTHDALKKRGWSFPSRCALCCHDEEDCNHIFVNCPFAQKVWNIMRNFVSVPQCRLQDHDVSYQLKNWPRQQPLGPKDWCSWVLMHALCWSIWRERNSRVFEDKATTPQVVCCRIGHLVCDWLCAAKRIERAKGESWFLSMQAKILPRIQHQVLLSED